MDISGHINTVINEKGLKQSFVANAVGISPDRFSKILNSNRKLLADEFLKICTVLDIDPNVFRNKQ